MQPTQIETLLDRHLLRVEKPGRYVGGEYNSVVKDWDAVSFRVAVAFPDIYDLGMSNLDIMLLYDQINQQPDLLAERPFCRCTRWKPSTPSATLTCSESVCRINTTI